MPSFDHTQTDNPKHNNIYYNDNNQNKAAEEKCRHRRCHFYLPNENYFDNYFIKSTILHILSVVWYTLFMHEVTSRFPYIG